MGRGVGGIEVALQENVLSKEFGLGDLLGDEVAEDFLGGQAFEPGRGGAVAEGLDAGVECASACPRAGWEVVSIDDADRDVRGADGEAIDEAKIHGVCVGVRDVGGPAWGDEGNGTTHA